MTYEDLAGEALRTPFEGWDFGVFRGRHVQGTPSWDHRTLVRERLDTAGAADRPLADPRLRPRHPRPRLRALHNRLTTGNPLHVTGHRFLATARRAPA